MAWDDPYEREDQMVRTASGSAFGTLVVAGGILLMIVSNATVGTIVTVLGGFGLLVTIASYFKAAAGQRGSWRPLVIHQIFAIGAIILAAIAAAVIFGTLGIGHFSALSVLVVGFGIYKAGTMIAQNVIRDFVWRQRDEE